MIYLKLLSGDLGLNGLMPFITNTKVYGTVPAPLFSNERANSQSIPNLILKISQILF
jgi:hypothetical protein